MPRSLPAFLLLLSTALPGQTFAPDRTLELAVSTSGGAVTAIFGDVSINDAGTVAFAAQKTAGGFSVYTVDRAGNLREIAPVQTTTPYQGAAINNSTPAQVATRRLDPGPVYRIVKYGDTTPMTGTEVGLYNGTGTNPSSALTAVDVNDQDVVAFVALRFVGSATYQELTAGSNRFVAAPTTLATWSSTASLRLRPQIANDGKVVVRDALNRTIAWPFPAGNPIVYGSGFTWTTAGDSPGISADGSTVAFLGNRGNGDGVFVDTVVGGQRTLVRIAGEGVDGMTGFVASQRVAVQRLDPATGGAVIVVAFAADQGGQTGLWRRALTLANDQGNLRMQLSAPTPVVRLGDVPFGSAVTGFGLTDGMNQRGQMALRLSFADGSTAVVRTWPAPYFNQGTGSWAQNILGNYGACGVLPPNPFCCPETIQRWGCYLSSTAMALQSLAIGASPAGSATDPASLNDFLRAIPGGYLDTGPHHCRQTLNPDKVEGFSGGQVVFLGARKTAGTAGYTLQDLASDLAAGVRVVCDVNGHFVLAVDASGGATPTVRIHDPGHSSRQTLDYYTTAGRWRGVRRFGYAAAPDARKWLLVSARSPVELLVTDPQGRRTGTDPRINVTYEEIPDASYFTDDILEYGGVGPLQQVSDKRVFISQPVDGSYRIEALGTGPGAYSVFLSGSDRDGNTSYGPVAVGTAFQGSYRAVGASYSGTSNVAFPGVRLVGNATSACSGPGVIAVNSTPASGAPGFSVLLGAAPPSAPIAFLIAAGARENLLSTLGATIHLDLLRPFVLVTLAADPDGNAELPLALPPGLTGQRAAFQAVFVDTQQCSGGSLLSSSSALEVTFQ